MAAALELALRGPDAYALARRAMESLQRLNIWPTPLNYELWLRAELEPAGPLAQAIEALTQSGATITEEVSEKLAAEHLTKQRLSEEIREAGDQLSRELNSVTRAIGAHHKSSQAYGRTLAGASEKLSAEAQAPDLKRIVDNLATATRRIEKENSQLEKQLSASTEEVERLREHLEQVRREAMTDALTNLPNRKAFDEALAKACAGEGPVSLALIDIDHFKKFNDTWGHQTGDQVLRYVAHVIGRLGVAPRVAARYGGEEFAVVFPGESAAQAAAALEEARVEIGSRMLKRRSTNEDLGAVTISGGVAQLKAGEAALSLVERADAALYASKGAGRNRITNTEMDVVKAA